MALLGVVVVLRDLRPELDLPDVDLGLVLARGLLLLGLLVLVLRVVQDAADGRLGLRGHLDEVEVAILRDLQRVGGLHDPDLLARLVDETDLGHTDALVDACGIAFRRLPVEPTRDRHLCDFGAARRQAVRGAAGLERLVNVGKYSFNCRRAHWSRPRVARRPRRAATVPRSPSPWRRSETARSSASRSPTTSMYGHLAQLGLADLAADRLGALVGVRAQPGGAQRRDDLVGVVVVAVGERAARAAWTGASQSGSSPPVCSSRIPMKRSKEPSSARWIITGRCSALSAPV